MLIESKDCPLSDVYLKAGFKNPAHFATCYKKRFGMTPSEAYSRGGDCYSETEVITMPPLGSIVTGTVPLSLTLTTFLPGMKSELLTIIPS